MAKKLSPLERDRKAHLAEQVSITTDVLNLHRTDCWTCHRAGGDSTKRCDTGYQMTQALHAATMVLDEFNAGLDADQLALPGLEQQKEVTADETSNRFESRPSSVAGAYEKLLAHVAARLAHRQNGSDLPQQAGHTRL